MPRPLLGPDAVERFRQVYAEAAHNSVVAAGVLGVSPQTVQRFRQRLGLPAGATGFGAAGVAQPSRDTLSRAARLRVQKQRAGLLPRPRRPQTIPTGRPPRRAPLLYRCPACLAHVPALPHCGEAA